MTRWAEAHQASLSITNSQSLLKLTCIGLVMLSNHLILCCPLVPLPSVFPSMRIFSKSQFFASGGQNIGKLSEKKVKVKSISHVRLFATSGTVAHQVLLSMGFSRQVNWSGLPFPTTSKEIRARISYLLSPGLLTHRNCEVTNVCCFKAAKFHSNLLAPIDNQYAKKGA